MIRHLNTKGGGGFPKCPLCLFITVPKHTLTSERKTESRGIKEHFYCSAHLKCCLNEYNYGNTNLSSVSLAALTPSILSVHSSPSSTCRVWGFISVARHALCYYDCIQHAEAFSIWCPLSCIAVVRWDNKGMLMIVFAGSEKWSLAAFSMLL